MRNLIGMLLIGLCLAACQSARTTDASGSEAATQGAADSSTTAAAAN